MRVGKPAKELGTVDARDVLGGPGLPEQAAALGFADDDAVAVLASAAAVLDRPEELAVVQEGADRLLARLGVLPATDGNVLFDGLPDGRDGLGPGVLPMLSMLVTAPAVARHQAGRGIAPDVSAATLADLGQQTWVHRLTTRTFGLDTYAWLALVWSGALYRLGRLQFDVEPLPALDGSGPEWVLSTHVPRTGPLPPSAVDAAMDAARPFFAAHFPELDVRDVYCRSWLLDPQLARVLPGSNLAAFQRRWRLYGTTRPGDADVLYFVFGRREPVELSRLPAETSLQRAVLSVWEAGGHFDVVEGRLAS